MPDSRRRHSYLLNPRFQLKWTAYLVAVVVLVMAALGVVIARTAARASDTAELAVKEAMRAYDESRTNNQLVKDSVAAAAPENATLSTIMADSLAEVDAKAEKNLADVKLRQQEIVRDRRQMQLLLGGGAALLVVLLLAMGIVITHRIVGPVHKMKRLLRRVSTGRLVVDERLRKGDELEDLFETFLQMTFSLRAMQVARLATLDATLKRAESEGTSPEVLEGMRALRAQMVLGIQPRRASMRPPPV